MTIIINGSENQIVDLTTDCLEIKISPLFKQNNCH